jgi:hypothetical protein
MSPFGVDARKGSFIIQSQGEVHRKEPFGQTRIRTNLNVIIDLRQTNYGDLDLDLGEKFYPKIVTIFLRIFT